MATPARGMPRVPSRPPSTARLRAGLRHASSAAATAPLRSPAPCCARSTPETDCCPLPCGTDPTTLHSAHDAVQHADGMPENIGISGLVVRIPSCVPLPGWDVLWLTRFRALASLRRLLRAPQAGSRTVTRRAGENPERGVCHERPGIAAGNRRLLPPQRACGIDLRAPRRQRRQANRAAA